MLSFHNQQPHTTLWMFLHSIYAAIIATALIFRRSFAGMMQVQWHVSGEPLGLRSRHESLTTLSSFASCDEGEIEL